MKAGFKIVDHAQGQGENRFESGACYSWLKAAPTMLIHHIEFFVFITKVHVGTASCRDIRAF
jgi:hypothetical protein